MMTGPTTRPLMPGRRGPLHIAQLSTLNVSDVNLIISSCTHASPAEQGVTGDGQGCDLFESDTKK